MWCVCDCCGYEYPERYIRYYWYHYVGRVVALCPDCDELEEMYDNDYM